jgi:hypothetical protein
MRINAVSNRVKNILLQREECRNSDNVLYIAVLRQVAGEKGIDVDTMSVPTLFLRMSEYKLPSPHSVSRARRKLQRCYPELRANDTVEGYRTAQEEEYIDYARKVTV